MQRNISKKEFSVGFRKPFFTSRIPFEPEGIYGNLVIIIYELPGRNSDFLNFLGCCKQFQVVYLCSWLALDESWEDRLIGLLFRLSFVGPLGQVTQSGR